MNLAELKETLPAELAPLCYCMQGFDHDALRHLRGMEEEGAQWMLAALRHAVEHPEEVAEEYGWVLHMVAAYHLSARRDPRAYPLLLQSFARDEGRVDAVWADTVTECLSSWLISTWDGDAQRLRDFISERSISPWSRVAAVGALAVLHRQGQVARETLLACMHEIDRNLAPEDDAVREYWAFEVARCRLTELSAKARPLFDTFPPGIIDLEDFDAYLSGALADRSPFDEPVQPDWENDFARWYLYQREAHREYFGDPEPARDWPEQDEDSQAWPQPYVRATPKVGRNDPCPCGSGKKYKKCCLGRLDAE